MRHLVLALAVVIIGLVVVSGLLERYSQTPWESACIAEHLKDVLAKDPNAYVTGIDATTVSTVAHKWGVDHWTGNDEFEYRVYVIAHVRLYGADVNRRADCFIEMAPDAKHIYSVRLTTAIQRPS